MWKPRPPFCPPFVFSPTVRRSSFDLCQRLKNLSNFHDIQLPLLHKNSN
jgi:hypothetical protein